MRIRSGGLRVFLLAVALALPLSACSHPQNGEPNKEVTGALVAWEDWRPEKPAFDGPLLDEAEKLAVREQDLERQRAWFKENLDVDIDSSEVPELVRWTSPSEGPKAWVECLNEAGWTATYAEGGGVMAPTDLLPDQNAAYFVDLFKCVAKYYRDPNLTNSGTPQYFGLYYDYWTSWMIPCIEAQGFGFSLEMPSREVFISSPDPFSWDPFTHISTPHVIEEGTDEGQALQEICPRYPPDGALLPTGG